MPQVHLPATHTDADLALAGALATALRSEELFVAWSVTEGRAEPVVPAALTEAPPEPPRRRGFLRRLFGDR